MSNLVQRDKNRLLGQVSFEQDDPTLRLCKQMAKAENINLLVGSLAIRLNQQKCINRSYLINRAGEIITHYDKIHLFDIQLPGGKAYGESASYQPGEDLVTADLYDFKLGLSICYDLRFSDLYQALTAQGANVLIVPAAFTESTGKAHWHTLLRARAIENAAYVIAPGQTGTHHDGSKSYGHSVIIDLWGSVIAEAGSHEGTVIQANIDIEQIRKIRNQMPSWRIRQNQSLPEKTLSV